MDSLFLTGLRAIFCCLEVGEEAWSWVSAVDNAERDKQDGRTKRGSQSLGREGGTQGLGRKGRCCIKLNKVTAVALDEKPTQKLRAKLPWWKQ